MKSGPHIESIGFLLGTICKVRRNAANEKLAKFGVHAGQDIVLYFLGLEDGQTVSQLMAYICVQPATISNTINRMVSSGLITKVKDEKDARVSRIFLTEKGKEVLVEVRKIWRTLEDQTIEGLSEEEKQLMKQILQRLLSNLEGLRESFCH